jgi:hypothetical protein
MPKKRQADVEKIRQMIREGLTNVEIHEKTKASEGFIGKIRRETDTSTVSTPVQSFQLTKGSQRDLIIMQTAMGFNSPDEAVDQLYKDFILINSKKARFDPNNEMSFGEVFQTLVEERDNKIDTEDLIEMARSDDIHKNMMMNALGLDESIFFLYNAVFNKYEGNYIDFINDSVKQHFIPLGWQFQKYYNNEFNGFHTLIIAPDGRKYYLPLK